ncbi:MAG: HI0074 family nucleotidyltransferase substrate-binding subunit [Gammaproteobacteria bacterium]|nr:HI0074 family nucleotidyltransferase substrate-binding subunit [Gammaproteobacteria bacterium]
MSNTDEIRWQQRHDSLGLALAHLTEACQLEELDDVYRSGLIKAFEICFKLSWKVLKDLLFFEGHNEKSPRSIFRKSFEVEYISESECEVLLNALDKRNLMSQRYRKERAIEAESLIRDVYYPVFVRVFESLGTRRTI